MITRRHFVQTSLAALTSTQLVPLNALAQSAPAVPETPPPGPPLLTAPTPDGVAVVWAVDAPSTGWVEYGDTEALGQKAYGAVDGLRPYDERAISVRLRGLKAGAKIFYRTVTVTVNFPNQYKMSRGTPVVSPTRSFVLPGPGPSTKIAIWNDTHQQAATLQAAQKLTDAFGPSLLVWNGDVVADQYMQEKDFDTAFLRPGKEIDPGSTWPMLFVRGNHDVRGAVARRLPHYVPRPLEHGYQNLLRVGPVGLIVLDTGEDKEGPQFYADLGEWALYREAQKAWLEKAINDPLFKDAPHKVVCCHIPLQWREPQDKGSWCPDGDERWSALLTRAGVKAVISGHTHRFWHDAPKPGRSYHQVIGGGPTLKSATVITLEADERSMNLQVVQAETRTQLLSLKLDA